MDNLLEFLVDFGGIEESKEMSVAPIELMTQFLIFISEGNMVHALELASEILVYEPNNLMIIEYKKSLILFIRQLEGKTDTIPNSINPYHDRNLAQDSQQKL